MNSREQMYVACVGLVMLALITVVALYKDIDGILFASVVSAISLIVGSAFGFRVAEKKAFDNVERM